MLSRRSFLALATVLMPWSTTIGGRALQPRTFIAGDGNSLSALVGDPDAARTIGRDALNSHPERLTRDTIQRVLARLDIPERGTPTTAGGTLRERYLAELRRDFAGSRIVDVQGWQLAETEVCLFAYLAIESDAGKSLS